jgi:peptide/nickel transport system substrate-binding protein
VFAAQDNTKQGEFRMSQGTKLAALAGMASALLLASGVAQPAAALDEAHRGGTLRLLAVGAGGTIDPHVNYTLQYWQLYQSIYDGLVTFKHAAGTDGFTIVPDLA